MAAFDRRLLPLRPIGSRRTWRLATGSESTGSFRIFSLRRDLWRRFDFIAYCPASTAVGRRRYSRCPISRLSSSRSSPSLPFLPYYPRLFFDGVKGPISLASLSLSFFSRFSKGQFGEIDETPAKRSCFQRRGAPFDIAWVNRAGCYSSN